MRRSYLVLCAVTAGWGTIPVLAGLVNLPSPLIVAVRLWTAAICLGVVLLVGRRRSEFPPLLSVRPARCLVTAAVLAGHWLALFAAYKRAPAGTVILIVYLAPVGVAALAPRLLQEKLARRTIVALVAATCGFGLLAAPTVQAAGLSGLMLSLVAAVLFVALILGSKPLASVYGGLRLAFMEMAGAGLVLIPVAAWSLSSLLSLPRVPAPSAAWLWLVVLGVVHTALGIAIYLSVLADLPATDVGIVSYLEPVVVVVCAWLWLGQRPALATVAGGLLVIAAGVSLVASGATPADDLVGDVRRTDGWRYRRLGDRAGGPVGGGVGER